MHSGLNIQKMLSCKRPIILLIQYNYESLGQTHPK